MLLGNRRRFRVCRCSCLDLVVLLATALDLGNKKREMLRPVLWYLWPSRSKASRCRRVCECRQSGNFYPSSIFGLETKECRFSGDLDQCEYLMSNESNTQDVLAANYRHRPVPGPDNEFFTLALRTTCVGYRNRF